MRVQQLYKFSELYTNTSTGRPLIDSKTSIIRPVYVSSTRKVALLKKAVKQAIEALFFFSNQFYKTPS